MTPERVKIHETVIDSLERDKDAPLSELIEHATKLRDEAQILSKLERDTRALLARVQDIIIGRMDKDGTTLSRVEGVSVSITEEQLPVIDDWDEVYKYILDNRYMHLLQRRMSSAAWREIEQTGERVPGTTPFVKRKLSMRKS